ncbi:MAG: DUF4349 domain-containing protein [Actinomycetales bacterium]
MWHIGQTQAGPGTRRRMMTALLATAVGATVALGTVAACSGPGGSSNTSGAAGGSGGASVGKAASDSAGKPAAGGFAQAPRGADTAGGSGDLSEQAVSAAVLQNRRLILKSSVALTVRDVFQTAGRVRALASGAGGYVGDEQTSGSGRAAASTLQLRVPQDQLGPLTDQVARLGKVTSRGQTSSDVTQQSIDVASRIATQKASVARIRALLAQATKISDIVAIEGELSQRESDLESLEAQLKSLDDAVDLATLTVSLNAQGAPAPKHKDNTGFLAGLSNGWDAFVTSLVAVLTVLGALLPFGIVLALVAVPLLVLWRRRRVLPGPPAVPASES